MKKYTFIMEQTCKALGRVSAKNIKEAREKLENGKFDEIFDYVDYEDGEIISIDEVIE